MFTGNMEGEVVDFESWVESERELLDSHYDAVSNVVGLGTNSGELRLRINQSSRSAPNGCMCVAGMKVESVTITRVEVPDPPKESPASVTYHAVVTGVTKTPDGNSEPFHTSNACLHQMTAMSWVEEYVPDFDLYPVILYSGDDSYTPFC